MKGVTYSSVALLCALAIDGSAAQPAVEGFATGANGWAGSSDLFTGSWSFTGGIARAVFVNTGGIAFPDICTLSNTPTATSGSFTGNYDTADINAIGFSFMAPTVLPASSAVELEWAGATSVYRHAFSVTQTGVWYHFSVSLQEADKMQWSVIAGSLDNFAAARQSVSRVALRVARSITLAHTFQFDDLFIAGQPGGASLAGGPGGVIVWDSLVAGVGYQVQSTTNLVSATWAKTESLTATGYFHTTTMTNPAKENESFRILFR